MNQDMIVLVQKSFRDVAPIADTVGATFYARLFETHPEVRPMFPEDIRPQARKLVQMLAMVVNGLHRLHAIQPEVEALARRHKDYGVADAHYPVVGETLIWTLEHHLGDAFTPQVRGAWLDAFTSLAQLMIGASHDAVHASGADSDSRADRSNHDAQHGY